MWPQTTIATAAVRNLLGGDFLVQRSRKPGIVAEAAFAILKRSSVDCTGNFFIDEEVLKQEGITDLGTYSVNPSNELQKDIFID